MASRRRPLEHDHPHHEMAEQTTPLPSARSRTGTASPPRRLSGWITAASTGGIFLLLLCYSLYTLADYLIPISLAILFSLLFKPVIKALRKRQVPRAVSAAGSILLLLGVMLAGLYTLSQPAVEWTDRAPLIIREFAAKLESLTQSLIEGMGGTMENISQPLRELQETTEKVEQIASPQPEAANEEPLTVKIQQPGLPTQLLVETPSILIGIGIFFVLLYFLLATSDSLLAKLVSLIPDLHDKKQMVRIIHDIQKDASYYLLTMLAINCVLGTVSSLALYLLGIPNPVLWGVMVGLLNFAPYLGPLISISIVTLIAILTFETFAEMLSVPFTLACLQILEGQFITPHIMGRQFALSPTLVFLSIVFWGGLWGVAGALIAVPLLVSFKVICENIEPLTPLARLLAR